MRNTKILQINDLAGVAGALTKYLRKAGHTADWVSFIDDDFGFIPFYGGRYFQDQKIFKYWVKGILANYDIIHVHFSWQMLDWLFSVTDKPIVMHYHGTELGTNPINTRMSDKRCKLVLVSGEQLKQHHPRAEYLPNPIDTEHFKPALEQRCRGFLTFKISYLKTVQVENMQASGAYLDIIDRDASSITYAEMPRWLNYYEGYLDVRHHKQRGLLTDLSKTALEALACGVKVYCNDKWYTELPEQHKPESVVHKLLNYYEGVLRQ